jgi:peptidoglycan/xylan/chitin deacetylase (PgdA/CDA1 family)
MHKRLNMKDRTRRAVLSSILRLKDNYAEGLKPPPRSFDGVEITPFFEDRQAAATISADFEIAWAFRGRSEEERLTRGIRCRRNVPMILSLLKETRVPITWATVGHLFLESCERGLSGCPHPEMPRPPKNLRWEGDWYRHDPCSDWKTQPHWYAPDLIRQILSSDVPHEIGSHSFSHIDFSETTSTRELVDHELKACIRVMSAHKLTLRSLVYPFNNMGHHYLDLIGGLGLTAVRHRDPRVRLSYPVATHSGVYKLYESMNLRRAKYYHYTEKAALLLEEAIRRQAAYHIWFHPSDPTEIFEKEFYEIIRLMAELCAQGTLWVVTMGDLAAYCEARERTTLEVQRAAKDITVRFTNKYDAARYGSTLLTLKIESEFTPKQVTLRADGKSQKLSWRTEVVKPKNGSRRALVVDVPANANELVVQA